MSTNSSKVEFVRSKLLEWYSKNSRDFPWRSRDANCYFQIIAEILLQRTRAETVSSFIDEFVEKFPSWQSITQAELEELENAFKSIGLWRQRSGRLLKLAQELGKYNWEFPNNRTELEKLPQIGQYTANAILMFCHGEAQPLLDSNMARVLERVFRKREKADIRYDCLLQNMARDVVSSENPKETNWAILDLAAMVCRPTPNCLICPLTQVCRFYSESKLRMN